MINKDNFTAIVQQNANKAVVPFEINELLVVEFYSRKDKKQTKYKLHRHHSCNPLWNWLVFIASKMMASPNILLL